VPVPFVPDDFEPPRGLAAPEFVLEPLGPQHNESDYPAWSSSIAHIRATPGYADSKWPREMTLDENLADLERHARDFESRKGFTYTVLDRQGGEVIGCVYIYPPREGEPGDAAVYSWVTADRAALDEPLWRTVSAWLRDAWPFREPVYAARPGPG
jgi:RimJ/RimL family protein N-acetyltransferase